LAQAMVAEGVKSSQGAKTDDAVLGGWDSGGGDQDSHASTREADDDRRAFWTKHGSPGRHGRPPQLDAPQRLGQGSVCREGLLLGERADGGAGWRAMPRVTRKAAGWLDLDSAQALAPIGESGCLAAM